MTNTVPNVSRELTIERDVFGAMHIKLGDFDFIQIQYQYPYTDNASTKALAERIAAILSAPSPAVVDGLNRYEVFPYLDDDVTELDICESDDGAFVKYDDAQAIIDGLRGENERIRLNIAEYNEAIACYHAERDQQAQRIGELEGLLREVHDTYRAAIHWEDLRGTMKRIDAALSAGKVG